MSEEEQKKKAEATEEEEKRKVEETAAFEEEQKKNAEAFAEEQLAFARRLAEKGTKENAIGFITINDFLNFHLREHFLIRAMFSQVKYVQLFDKSLFLMLANLLSLSMVITVTMEMENIFKVNDDVYEVNRNEDKKWQIARTDRNGIEEDIIFYTCDYDTHVPSKNRQLWHNTSRTH